MKKKLVISEKANNFLLAVDAVFKESTHENEDLAIKAFKNLDEVDKLYVINHKDQLDNTILLEASCHNERFSIELVKLGFNINAFNVNGKSVLINAIQNEHFKLIDILLDYGVDVNYARMKSYLSGERTGSSALMFASEKGQYEVVEKLINKNADVKYMNDMGQYAALYAIGKKDEHLKCFNLLIKADGSIAKRLDNIGYGVMEKIIKFGTIDFVPLAIDNGAYNDRVYLQICDYIDRNVGFYSGQNELKNSREEAREIAAFISTYTKMKNLENNLEKNQTNFSKKIKL